MGKRGPKRTPTELLALRGNPGKRKRHGEPKPPTESPSCPSWLNVEAKREWRRIVPELERLHLIARVDRAALAAYCQSWARWLQAERVIEDHGMTMVIETKGGGTYEQQRPEVSIAQKEKGQMKAFAALFGFSPSDRASLAVGEPPKERDVTKEFLFGPRRS